MRALASLTVAWPFFTIGHSTRPLEEFLALLRDAGVRLVVDVRSFPGSRANPQYAGEALAEALAGVAIGYEHLATLGGLRRRVPDVPATVNAFWRNQSFHNYADHALSDEFHRGLVRLLELGRATPCAVMCAEAVWWRCHRRIIADYLIAAGETVLHIMGPNRVTSAHMTAAARLGPMGTVIYPLEP